MSPRQRKALWAAAGLLVLVAAMLALRSRWDPYAARVALRAPALPSPDLVRIFTPGADGAPPRLVVVDNTPEARPQAGLADAALVIVVPTEARITRFLASHGLIQPQVVGPVRSARGYMLDLAAEVGGILVHAGQSAEALARIRRERLPVINEFWTPGPFMRDGRGRMPHNLFAKLDGLRAVADELSATVRARGLPYALAVDAPQAQDAAPAAAISLDYGPLYAARYQYDARWGRYRREQGDQPHLDADGRQVTAAAVLVAFVRWWEVWENGSPSSRLGLTGTGRLAVLAQGRLREGTWSRLTGGPLILRDALGNPLVLPPGPVWIELLPQDRPFVAQADLPK